MKIVLFDAIGSFSGTLVSHWREKGHTVTMAKEYNPELIVGQDFIFCEWADINSVYCSQKRWPIPLVVRLHSYELFTDYPRQIAWWNVDCCVTVAEHCKDALLSEFVPACPVRVIPNGIRTELWNHKKREHIKNPKVAFVGDFSHKKGMQLFLQCVAAWPKATFHIAGPAYDRRYFVTLLDAAKKAGCFDRIAYAGPQPSMDKFLDDKDYILCTSPWEGHNYSLMEAMTKGIKPLVYNFPGAEDLYPEQCLWLTLKDFKQRTQEPISSPAYRQWVLDKGWTAERMLDDYDKLLTNPKVLNEEDIKDYYDAFTPYMAGALQNPYGRYKHIFELIDKHIGKEEEVSDFGCGVGITSAEIKKRVEHVFAYDVSAEALKIAEERFPGITFICRDIVEAVPPFVMRSDCLNTACLFDSLEHLLPEKREKVYAGLQLFGKILITIPIKQRRPGNRLQIVDEEIELEEIQKAFPNHFVSATSKYGVEYADQYRFIRLDKIAMVVEKPKEEELIDAAL